MSSSELEAVLAAPAMQPPAGTTPDFVHPPNRNGLAWFVTIFCVAVGTVCLFFRAYARMWKPKKVRIVEVLMFCGYVAYCVAAYAGLSMVYTPGYYVHQWNLHNKDLIRPLYLILIYGCAYSVVLPCLKIAILLDWCDIFVVHARRESAFWWGCMFVSAIQAIWGVLCVILLNTQCVPYQAIWDFYLESKCYKASDVMLTSASVQVVSDVCMVLLPQKVIWGLNMNVQKKLGVAVMFGVGLLGCISAIVRLSTTVTFAGTEDQMYYIGPLLFWAWAEMTCGFFILTVPCLPRLLSESRLSRSLKNMLGLTPRKPSDPYRYPAVRSKSSSGHTGGSRKKSQGQSGDVMMNTVFYQMDDRTVKSSESQEQLRVDDDGRKLSNAKFTDDGGVQQGTAKVSRSVSRNSAEA